MIEGTGYKTRGVVDTAGYCQIYPAGPRQFSCGRSVGNWQVSAEFFFWALPGVEIASASKVTAPA